ncbi:MAG: segregation/condensation protein A [Candidatus Eisenbacteria sp.]|nr:segregation/condensation protein A [Candidatus Eisenbacteria bacterium]
MAETIPATAGDALPAYLVRLENFEGPLDLLLHLIKQAEIEIWQISISKITKQYLDYLRRMEALNVEIAGEFLVMAATLMRIKSKRLLPRPPIEDADEDEPQTEEELIARLMTYKMYKEAAGRLRKWREDAGPRFPRGFRPSLPPGHELPLREIDLFLLAKTLREIEQRRREEAEAVHQVELESVRLEDQLTFLLGQLEAGNGQVAFGRLFTPQTQPVEIAVTLLAALELARQQVVLLLQDDSFGEIWVRSRLSEGAGIAWRDESAPQPADRVSSVAVSTA